MHQPLRPIAPGILRLTLHRGLGAQVWDTGGKAYFDFHAAYAALNHGHCHPRLVAALQGQAGRLTLTSGALAHDLLGSFAEKITGLFGYECVIPMNSGTEACETAIKYARRWAYEKKGMLPDTAEILVPSGTYSGHSLTTLSAAEDPALRKFGPALPGFRHIPYGDLSVLAAAIREPRIAALLLEPIQGEAGVVVPPPGYLREAARVCAEQGVLLIADEIQTGLGRTGTLTACAREGVRPDLLILGKALAGGMLPVSAVLCDRAVGDGIDFDEQSSTFAANPLACRVAIEALAVVEEEMLAERAEKLGRIFREEVAGWKIPWITEVRGRGLLNAVEITPDFDLPAWALSRALEEEGVISLPLHARALRFSPPLVIQEEELSAALERIRRAFARASGG